MSVPMHLETKLRNKQARHEAGVGVGMLGIHTDPCEVK